MYSCSGAFMECHSEPSQAFKMELFVKIFNRFQSLVAFEKRSMLDVWLTLVTCIIYEYFTRFSYFAVRSLHKIYQDQGFSLTLILPYKDKIADFVLIRENKGQWKPVFSHILCSVLFTWMLVKLVVNYEKPINNLSYSTWHCAMTNKYFLTVISWLVEVYGCCTALDFEFSEVNTTST